jgi:hypothetical protein
MTKATMQAWSPHAELAQLSAALSAEILAAPDAELRQVLAECGVSAAATAQDVRDVIAHALGESDDVRPGLAQPPGKGRLFLAL